MLPESIIRCPASRACLAMPPLKTVVAVPVYVFAAVAQHKCHRYMAGLKKYSVPDQGAFRYLVSPHYTFECLVYVSLAVAGAPGGRLCNRTILSGLLFVVVNLGVTANTTKKWYAEKFGAQSVAGKWRMIPYVF